jgi:hypothetical protein
VKPSIPPIGGISVGGSSSFSPRDVIPKFLQDELNFIDKTLNEKDVKGYESSSIPSYLYEH